MKRLVIWLMKRYGLDRSHEVESLQAKVHNLGDELTAVRTSASASHKLHMAEIKAERELTADIAKKAVVAGLDTDDGDRYALMVSFRAKVINDVFDGRDGRERLAYHVSQQIYHEILISRFIRR